MSRFQQRLFIAIDEWLGVVLLCWAWGHAPEAFWPIFIFWALCVYVIAYGSYFGVWDQVSRWIIR